MFLTTMIWNLAKVRAVQLALAALIGIGGGTVMTYRLHPPIHEVMTRTDTKVVTVEKPVITEKIVDRVVKDPADQRLIKQVLKDSADLAIKVSQLQFTIANLQSKGSGPVVVVRDSPVPENVVREFKDYQLDATFDLKEFKYTLKQEFKIVSLFGKEADGSPSAVIGLFQITPDGPVNIPAKNVVLFTVPTEHWFTSPRLQAGVGYIRDNATYSSQPVVALQWLKHGRTTANEDIRYAILSPTISGRSVGILPVSFNIGSLKHVPLTNIWISPFLGLNHNGVAVTATF